jgi:hypothetical protein
MLLTSIDGYHLQRLEPRERERNDRPLLTYIAVSIVKAQGHATPVGSCQHFLRRAVDEHSVRGVLCHAWPLARRSRMHLTDVPPSSYPHPHAGTCRIACCRFSRSLPASPHVGVPCRSSPRAGQVCRPLWRFPPRPGTKPQCAGVGSCTARKKHGLGARKGLVPPSAGSALRDRCDRSHSDPRRV